MLRKTETNCKNYKNPDHPETFELHNYKYFLKKGSKFYNKSVVKST